VLLKVRLARNQPGTSRSNRPILREEGAGYCIRAVSDYTDEGYWTGHALFVLSDGRLAMGRYADDEYADPLDKKAVTGLLAIEARDGVRSALHRLSA
jgi:hypothetical protein